MPEPPQHGKGPDVVKTSSPPGRRTVVGSRAPAISHPRLRASSVRVNPFSQSTI